MRTNASPLGDSVSRRLTSMVPPSGVNLMAFERKFNSTWFSRTLSQQTFSAEIS